MCSKIKSCHAPIAANTRHFEGFRPRKAYVQCDLPMLGNNPSFLWFRANERLHTRELYGGEITLKQWRFEPLIVGLVSTQHNNFHANYFMK